MPKKTCFKEERIELKRNNEKEGSLGEKGVLTGLAVTEKPASNSPLPEEIMRTFRHRFLSGLPNRSFDLKELGFLY